MVKMKGVNESEQYAYNICSKSFLSLWSYTVLCFHWQF
jgi:hypothetical protein